VQKKTIVDQIEITRSGIVQIRFGLLILDDATGAEEACNWHRTAIEPGANPQVLIDAVNAHLAQMGKAAIQSSCCEKIRAVIATVHTPALVKEFADRKAALEVKAK
jgi:hypothetical protein